MDGREQWGEFGLVHQYVTYVRGRVSMQSTVKEFKIEASTGKYILSTTTQIEVQLSARREARRGVDGLAAGLVARGNQYSARHEGPLH